MVYSFVTHNKDPLLPSSSAPAGQYLPFPISCESTVLCFRIRHWVFPCSAQHILCCCLGAGGTVLLRSQAKSQSHLFPPLKLSLPHSYKGTALYSQGPSGKKKSHNNAAFKWQLQSWPTSLFCWEQPAALSPSHSCSSKFTPQTLAHIAHIALPAHWHLHCFPTTLTSAVSYTSPHTANSHSF